MKSSDDGLYTVDVHLKIYLIALFAGQKVGIREVDDHVWHASFMHFDLGIFYLEVNRVEHKVDNSFAPRVLPGIHPSRRQ